MSETVRDDEPAVRFLKKIVPICRFALPGSIGLALLGALARVPIVVWAGLVGAAAAGVLFLGTLAIAASGGRASGGGRDRVASRGGGKTATPGGPARERPARR